VDNSQNILLPIRTKNNDRNIFKNKFYQAENFSFFKRKNQNTKIIPTTPDIVIIVSFIPHLSSIELSYAAELDAQSSII